MACQGTIVNGVVVLDGAIHLPEGAAVRVETLSSDANVMKQPAADDSLFRMNELAVDTGVPDLAANVDRYLYGHPQVDDAR